MASLDDQIQLLSSQEDDYDEKDENDPGIQNITPGENIQNGFVFSEFPAPELAPDKRFHLYVIFSSEDRETVYKLVAELETKFGMKCLFADRDFQPGKEIRLNVMEGMQDSMKNLLILTPNFADSRYCMHESEIAFKETMESGINCMIPVLLKDCDIPYPLLPKTYINGTLPGLTMTDIAFRVRNAFITSEPARKILPVNLTSGNSIYKNGVYVDIEAQRFRCCWCRPTIYKFKLTNSFRTKLQAKNIEVPVKMLRWTISLLNSSRAIKKYDCINWFKLFCWGCCSCPFFYFIMMVCRLILLLSESTLSDSLLWVDVILTILLPTVFSIIVCKCGISKAKKARVDSIIQNCLQNMCCFNSGILHLPEADVNRHNVIKDRMCLCKYYEYHFVYGNDPVATV